MTVRPSGTLAIGCVLLVGGVVAQLAGPIARHPFIVLVPIVGAALISTAVARWPGLHRWLDRSRHGGGWTTTKH